MLCRCSIPSHAKENFRQIEVWKVVVRGTGYREFNANSQKHGHLTGDSLKTLIKFGSARHAINVSFIFIHKDWDGVVYDSAKTQIMDIKNGYYYIILFKSSWVSA